MYDDGLAATGAGVLLVGGHAIGLPTIITIAVGAMVIGILAFRVATRKQRAASLN